MTDAGTVVDVIGADDGTHEFLCDIGGFVARTAGRTGSHDGIGTIFLDDGLEAGCRVFDGFLPGYFDQGAAFAAFSHHGMADTLGKNLGIIQIIPAIKTF